MGWKTYMFSSPIFFNFYQLLFNWIAFRIQVND
jgi:hypothetical protein